MGRRAFIGGLAAVAGGALLGSCGAGGTSGAEPSIAPSRLFDTRTLRADGRPQRTVWAFSDADGYLTGGAPDSITVSASADDGTELMPATAVDAHRDGLLVPYYPVELVFPDSDPVEFRFEVAGESLTSFVDARGVAGDGLLGPGDAMVAVATPTFDDPGGVDPVCTRSPEPCPFHETSLDEALAEGRRTILNVSTPAFCSNQIACGPGLEVLVGLAPSIDTDVAIVHAEVYTSPTATELGPVAPVVDALGLWYEPALYVVGGDGLIEARLDFMWDATELAALLGVRPAS